MSQRIKRGERRDLELLQERATAAERARLAVHRTARARDAHRPETYAAWHEAVDTFWAAVTAAYPAGFWTAVRQQYERLARGEPAAVDMAVHFLEADLWFFRSGYVKEELIRRLARLEVSPAVARRLRRVVVQAVERRDRREFRRYCRLAHRLADGDLLSALQERGQSSDPGIRRRAEWMLAAVEHRPVRTP